MTYESDVCQPQTPSRQNSALGLSYYCSKMLWHHKFHRSKVKTVLPTPVSPVIIIYHVSEVRKLSKRNFESLFVQTIIW